MRHALALPAALIALGVVPDAAIGATFFVDPAGSDAGACTDVGVKACATLSGAVARARAAGTGPHLVRVAAGTFVDSPAIPADPNLDGLTVTSAGAGGRAIVAQDTGQPRAVMAIAARDVTLDALDVEASADDRAAIAISGPGGTVLRGVHVLTRQGLVTQGGPALEVRAPAVTVARSDLESRVAGAPALLADEAATGLAVADSTLRQSATVAPTVPGAVLAAAAELRRSQVLAPSASPRPAVALSSATPTHTVIFDSSLLLGGSAAVGIADRAGVPAGQRVLVRNSTLDAGAPGVDDGPAGGDAIRITLVDGGSAPTVTATNGILVDPPGTVGTGTPSIDCRYSDVPAPAAARAAGVSCDAGTSGNTSSAPVALFLGGVPGVAWDHRLRPASPAIDSADPAGLAADQSTADLEGFARILAGGGATCPSGRLDRGAYEFHGFSCADPGGGPGAGTPPADPGGGAGGGEDPQGTAPEDRVAPWFRARLAARRLRRGGIGTIRVRLSESARVTGRVTRREAGRRVGRACRPGARRGRRCVRARWAGGVYFAAGAGPARAPLGTRRLVPGRYRLTLVAEDDAGNRSRPVRLDFVVVRARGRRR